MGRIGKRGKKRKKERTARRPRVECLGRGSKDRKLIIKIGFGRVLYSIALVQRGSLKVGKRGSPLGSPSNNNS